MKRFLERNLPPGYPYKIEVFTAALAAAYTILVPLLAFLYEFTRQRQQLYLRIGVDVILDESRVMLDFVYILGAKLHAPLIFAALILIIMTASHLAAFFEGGRSIYTMRRLPRRMELPRRCILVPLIWAAAILLLTGAMLLIFYWIYMTFTPEACLSSGQWSKLWR